MIKLVIVDYVVFGLFMCISTGVGIYYAIKNFISSRNNDITKDQQGKSVMIEEKSINY